MTGESRKPWEEYQALYVHIPFCRQKCLYCDFASYAGFGEEKMHEYALAVCREIEQQADKAAMMADGATVYFGGGTPSLLPAEDMQMITDALRRCGFWRQPAEATVEANPGTACAAKLEALRRAGFDRISFGVQSLNDGELRAIGRIHTAAEAAEAVELARRAGFKRISADLIYGLPGQTEASLAETLEGVLALVLDHISVYGLIVEEGTPLEKLVGEGKLQLPDEDAAGNMYDYVQKRLKRAGFERYEISNYARNGQQSLHNTVYWQYRPYMAFGAAACSFDGRRRRTAAEGVDEYIAAVNGAGEHLYIEENLSEEELLEEFMFMGLRRSAGADLHEARERFGTDVMERFGSSLQPFLDRKLAVYDEEKGRLRLTEQGMALGNLIFEIFVNG